MFGDIFSAILGYQGTQDTNASRESIANSANAFSAQQFATRYQTTTKDMEAAGLNPMLAYSQGGGSPPTGQQAQIENPMSSALESYHQSKQRDLIASQVQNVNEDTNVKRSQVHINEEQAKLFAAQTIKAAADERASTTSANESTYRLWSQQNVQNPTQKALAAHYWSQVDVNKANLPKIASEIVSNGAFASQAKAQAFKAIQEGKITQADYQRALNEQAFESSSVGKTKRYLDYGVNTAGKISDIVKSNRTNVTNEHGTYYDKSGNPSGGFSRSRSSR